MNVVESRNPIYSQAFLARVLLALQTNPAAALLDTPLVHLMKSPPGSYTPASVEADFTPNEADYDDYVAPALGTTLAVTVDAFTPARTGTHNFPVTTNPPLVTNTIVGYWIDDADGLVCYELFDPGEYTPMAVAGDLLVLVLKLPLTPYYALPATV